MPTETMGIGNGWRSRFTSESSLETIVGAAQGLNLAPHAFGDAMPANNLAGAVRLFLSVTGLLCVAAVESATGGGKSPGTDQAQQKPSKSGPVTDYPSLIKSLRALGAGATAVGEVDQPFFSIRGGMIKVHAEDVEVFQYVTAAAVDAEAAPISHDGMAVGVRKFHWIGSPHFQEGETPRLVRR